MEGKTSATLFQGPEETVRCTSGMEKRLLPPWLFQHQELLQELPEGDPVNKETLQHIRYPEVFSLGDVAQIPMGNTGGSVRKQYKVLVDNLIAKMEGKTLDSKYAGYTVCPLITSIGTVMLAEFDWTVKPVPSFPLDPTVERWIFWLMKVYALKPMTMIGMLKTGQA